MLIAGRTLSCVFMGNTYSATANRWRNEMKALWKKAQQFLRSEEGVTAIEYALIAALIAVVIIAAVTLVGEEVSQTFTTVGETLNNTNN